MIDPRYSIINQRLEKIRRIIAVSSGKGGVGKSMVSTALALSLANEGFRVGLFDLDFTGPSTHIILGIPKNVQPREEKGIVPPIVYGLEYMSLVYYVGDNPAPMRGGDVSNALIELLSVTQWGALDFLVIDMPPGIGDAVLDLMRLVQRIEYLIVTTPSLLAFEVVKKQVALLCELKMPILGIIENMKMSKSDAIAKETIMLGIKYLGEVPFDAQVEASIGNPEKLMATALGSAMPQIKKALIDRGNPNVS
ncbi:MAG: Mrp/NBP35 family ATP-binding protein [Candidatus Bathyarchaeota archaeon]|nr:Mrp/NBP35 family ATP-binding protein [Candidatus Bathyarchaeota archaeon]